MRGHRLHTTLRPPICTRALRALIIPHISEFGIQSPCGAATGRGTGPRPGYGPPRPSHTPEQSSPPPPACSVARASCAYHSTPPTSTRAPPRLAHAMPRLQPRGSECRQGWVHSLPPPPPPQPSRALGLAFHHCPWPLATLGPARFALQGVHLGLQSVLLVPQRVPLLPQPVTLRLCCPLLLLGLDKALVQVPLGCLCRQCPDVLRVLVLLHPLLGGSSSSNLCGGGRAGSLGGASVSGVSPLEGGAGGGGIVSRTLLFDVNDVNPRRPHSPRRPTRKDAQAMPRRPTLPFTAPTPQPKPTE